MQAQKRQPKLISTRPSASR